MQLILTGINSGQQNQPRAQTGNGYTNTSYSYYFYYIIPFSVFSDMEYVYMDD